MIAFPAAATSFFANLRDKRAQNDHTSCGWYESSLDLMNGLEVREHSVDAQALKLWTTSGKAPTTKSS